MYSIIVVIVGFFATNFKFRTPQLVEIQEANEESVQDSIKNVPNYVSSAVMLTNECYSNWQRNKFSENTLHMSVH